MIPAPMDLKSVKEEIALKTNFLKNTLNSNLPVAFEPASTPPGNNYASLHTVQMSVWENDIEKLRLEEAAKKREVNCVENDLGECGEKLSSLQSHISLIRSTIRDVSAEEVDSLEVFFPASLDGDVSGLREKLLLKDAVKEKTMDLENRVVALRSHMTSKTLQLASGNRDIASWHTPSANDPSPSPTSLRLIDDVTIANNLQLRQELLEIGRELSVLESDYLTSLEELKKLELVITNDKRHTGSASINGGKEPTSNDNGCVPVLEDVLSSNNRTQVIRMNGESSTQYKSRLGKRLTGLLLLESHLQLEIDNKTHERSIIQSKFQSVEIARLRKELQFSNFRHTSTLHHTHTPEKSGATLWHSEDDINGTETRGSVFAVNSIATSGPVYSESPSSHKKDGVENDNRYPATDVVTGTGLRLPSESAKEIDTYSAWEHRIICAANTSDVSPIQLVQQHGDAPIASTPLYKEAYGGHGDTAKVSTPRKAEMYDSRGHRIRATNTAIDSQLSKANPKPKAGSSEALLVSTSEDHKRHRVATPKNKGITPSRPTRSSATSVSVGVAHAQQKGVSDDMLPITAVAEVLDRFENLFHNLEHSNMNASSETDELRSIVLKQEEELGQLKKLLRPHLLQLNEEFSSRSPSSSLVDADADAPLEALPQHVPGLTVDTGADADVADSVLCSSDSMSNEDEIVRVTDVEECHGTEEHGKDVQVSPASPISMTSLAGSRIGGMVEDLYLIPDIPNASPHHLAPDGSNASLVELVEERLVHQTHTPCQLGLSSSEKKLESTLIGALEKYQNSLQRALSTEVVDPITGISTNSTLEICVLSARNIPLAKKLTGSADPFVELSLLNNSADSALAVPIATRPSRHNRYTRDDSCSGAMFRTTVKRKELRPSWVEGHTFSVKELDASIRVRLMDANNSLDGADIIGECHLSLAGLRDQTKHVVWLPVGPPPVGVRSRPRIPPNCAIKLEALLIYSRVQQYTNRLETAIAKLESFHNEMESYYTTF